MSASSRSHSAQCGVLISRMACCCTSAMKSNAIMESANALRWFCYRSIAVRFPPNGTTSSNANTGFSPSSRRSAIVRKSLMMFLRVSPPWSVGPTLKLSTVFPMLTLKAGCRIPQLCGKLPPCPASLQPDELAHGNHAIEWFGRAVGKFHEIGHDIIGTGETVLEELRNDLAGDDPRAVELCRR